MIKPDHTHTLCVAPMMGWTDRHCRYFHRLLAPHARLYTEMVTAAALLHGDRNRLLDFDATEHPLALQLGGSDPDDLSVAAKMGEDWGYNEINLNCGCPSERVKKGRFGACLMAEPDLVAECVTAMKNAVTCPVTVKCRIGIDNEDDFAFLDQFIGTIAAAGCNTFIIHARKAWLTGLSPKENRTVPPLRYDRAQAIKEKYPALNIILNGGLITTDQITDALTWADGVMIGREAYENPYSLALFENALWGTPLPDRAAILANMHTYAATIDAADPAYLLPNIARHMLGLYRGQTYGRAWRRMAMETARAGSLAAFTSSPFETA